MSRVWPILIALAVFATGCGEDGPSSPEQKALSACFTVTVGHPFASCPQTAYLTFDASCSSDPETTADSLLVRWDFQNDGMWDTPFRPARQLAWFAAPVVGPRAWIARGEVQNRSGRTVQSTVSADLGPRPVPPDLIVNRVWFSVDSISEEIDTVGVGQDFTLCAGLLRCGQTGDPAITVIYALDGLIVDVQHAVLDVPFDCESWCPSGQHLDIPGRYTVSVVLDAKEAVVESSEANNAATAALWVVPRAGGSISEFAR